MPASIPTTLVLLSWDIFLSGEACFSSLVDSWPVRASVILRLVFFSSFSLLGASQD